MSGENTFKTGVIEQIRELAESPETAEAAIAELNKPMGASVVTDAARRTNREVAELSESKAEEKAAIQAAQDQADRFNNWWGRVTGQHAQAVAELETVTESSTAKINMIGDRIEELQGEFDHVIEMEFERVSDPEAYAERLEASRLAYEANLDEQGNKTEHQTLEAV